MMEQVQAAPEEYPVTLGPECMATLEALAAENGTTVEQEAATLLSNFFSQGG